MSTEREHARHAADRARKAQRKRVLSDAEVAAVVAYVRDVQRQAGLGSDEG